MSIRKSLIALAAMALAMMGLASSAMAATDGVVRHVTTKTPIPENRELHFVGWARFAKSGSPGDKLECHVTSVVKTTGTTGSTAHVSDFHIPETSKCTGGGEFNKCLPKAGHQSTNLPWHVTATPTDFDVTGSIVIDTPLEKCELGHRSATLTFSEVTLKPLKTGSTAATGTEGRLGTTAAAGTSTTVGDPIAGAEISGTGTADVVDVFGFHHNINIEASGELELTSADRCTWYLSSN